MDEFWIYLQLGFTHITDMSGFDHILFLVALCAVFQRQHWRKLLLLLTAFTLGHAFTLAWSVLASPILPARVVEFLIPLTILATSLGHVLRKDSPDPAMRFQYASALAFGFVHGMGFSGFLRGLLGMEDSIARPLLAFNIGLELGQVIVVGIVMVLSTFFIELLRVHARDWKLFVSGATSGISLILAFENKIW